MSWRYPRPLVMLGYPLRRRSVVILGPQNTGMINIAEWRALKLEWNDVVDKVRGQKDRRC